MDNFDGKSAKEIKSELLKNIGTQQVKKEDPKQEPRKDVVVVEPKKEELILGKFKSQDDLIKAYQEAEKTMTKTAQELAEAKKTVTAPAKVETTVDPIWAQLFPETKVSKPKVDFDPLGDESPNEIAEMRKELELLKRAGAYSIAQQQNQMGKINAAEKLKTDPALPWSADVAADIENDIFRRFPGLRLQANGYEVAHTILKGERADSIANARVEAARIAASDKKKDKENASVETPSNSTPEPKVDYSSLDAKKLRSFLNKEIGTLDR